VLVVSTGESLETFEECAGLVECLRRFVADIEYGVLVVKGMDETLNSETFTLRAANLRIGLTCETSDILAQFANILALGES
jgi:hypothetical protein